MVANGQPPGDETTHARERAAIVGLALATLPNEAEVRTALERHHGGSTFPGLRDSLQELTQLTEDGTRLSHRSVSLRLLTKVAQRRGMQRFGEAKGVKGYLETSVRNAGHECEELCRRGHAHHEREDHELHHHAALRDVRAAVRASDPEVQDLLDGLAAASEGRAPAWRSFAPKAGSLRLTDAEMALPRCSDDEAVMVGGIPSTRVVTWFASPKPASAFSDWTDVRTWQVQCSLFYNRILPVDEDAIPAGAEEYSTEFLEEIQISEGKTMYTPLVFTRRVVAPNLYSLYFTMPPARKARRTKRGLYAEVPTEDLLVDAGSLVAREDPNSPPEQRTHLFAEKLLKFADPGLATWPTLLCDLFWMELTILAALGCRHD